MTVARWQTRPLGKCAKFLSGGTPSKSRAEFWEGDLPWVSSGEMAKTWIEDTPLHVTAAAAKEGSRIVPSNTILAVVRGMSLAKEFRVALTKREVSFNQDLKALVCEPDIDSEFLFYALVARRAYIRDLATEASHGTKKIETDVLAAVEIAVPSIAIQKRAVGILSPYDELIDNNRRRMAFLEESARLLYREWFVRFRFPGYALKRAFVGVPTGWKLLPIGEVADCVGGGTPSTGIPAYWEDGDLTWVTPTDVTRNKHLVILDSEKKITEVGLKASSAKLVPPHAVLMTSRASVGYFAIAGREVCTNQGFISIVARDPLLAPYILFHLSERVEEIRAMGSGSTFPEVSRSKFREFEILLPSSALTSAFSEQAAQLLMQIRILKRQNERLQTARDLLLPRLMDGHIIV